MFPVQGVLCPPNERLSFHIYIVQEARSSEIFMREVYRYTREVTGCNRQLRATLSARPVS